jgi:hypothetical protein
LALANSLLTLWKLRIRVAVGLVLAGAVAFAAHSALHTTVYASASTEMLVDSPDSALANANTDITAYLARADVFARLMTSAEALQYIGNAAGIPGNLIDASGPLEVNGSPTAAHTPVAIQGGRDVPAKSNYTLSFNQNPLLPTVEVDAQAPTTAQAIALANGAVTGFSAFLTHLEAGNSVSPAKSIVVSELGAATGGIVDSGASSKLAGIIFIAVFLLWCGLVLFVRNLAGHLRVARAERAQESGSASLPDREVALDHPEPEDGDAEREDDFEHAARAFDLDHAERADELDRAPKRRNGKTNGHRAPVAGRAARDLLDDLLGADLTDHARDRDEEEAARGEVGSRP